MANTKNISFSEKYKEEYDFLIAQDNPSRLVCELIRKYRLGEDDFESRVKDIMLKYLGNQPQVIVAEGVNNVSQSNQNSVDDIAEKISQIEDPW